MTTAFLDTTKKIFAQYKQLGEKTFEQLPSEKLFFQYNSESNSIAVIVKHLHGNMMSRWTDFLTSDGEKEWRQRDAEFENDLAGKEELLRFWNEGWACLFSALEGVKEEDLTKTVYIRNEAHTVENAILRQLAHYPYHVGQIVYIGKMIVGEDWKSLSIPRNKSAEFNSEKFSKPKKNL
jgi:hypothetical protein